MAMNEDSCIVGSTFRGLPRRTLGCKLSDITHREETPWDKTWKRVEGFRNAHTTGTQRNQKAPFAQILTGFKNVMSRLQKAFIFLLVYAL